MAWTEKYVTADAAGGGDGSSGTPWTLAEAIAGVTAGCRVNVKAGTYANTTNNRDFAVAGTTTAPIWWRGYKTTIGDQDTNAAAVAGTDIPLFTFTTGQMITSAAYNTYSNIAVSSAATATYGAWYLNAWARLYRCRVSTSANQYAFTVRSGGARSVLLACHLSGSGSGNVLQLAGAGTQVYGCYIGGGTNGIFVGADNCAIDHCILDNQGGVGIDVDYAVGIRNCTFYSPAGHGIEIGTAVTTFIANCYFEDVNQASKGAIYNTTGGNIALVTPVDNGYYNCTANYSGLAEDFVIWDNGTLAAAALVDPANDDFDINSNAEAIGFPGAFESITSTVGSQSLGASPPAGGIAEGDIVAAQYVLAGHDNYTGGDAGTLTLPAVGDVQDGVVYGTGGTGSEGTFAAPAIADVRSGTTYGASGTEFTGEMLVYSTWTETEKKQIRYRLGIDGTEETPAANTPELGSIGSDWSDTEKSHIRYRLGIDGTEAAPTNTPTLGTLAANVTEWKGATVATPNVAGIPKVDITHVNGTEANGAATVDANMVQISGDATAADNLEAACDGTGYNVGSGNIVAASVTGSTGSVAGAVGSIGAGGITSSSFASGAITSSAMADNSIDSKVIAADAINAASLKADALTVIGAAVADAVWDESSSAHHALGSFGLQAYDTNNQANALIEAVNLTGVVVASTSKTGYKLASDGLDSISTTAPTGPASNFREMLVQMWRRFFKKSTLTATELKTYADDGNAVVTTQAVSNVAGTETQGPAT